MSFSDKIILFLLSRLMNYVINKNNKKWLKKSPEYDARREEVYQKWAAALKEREEQKLAKMRARVAEIEAEEKDKCELELMITPRFDGNYIGCQWCRMDEQ